MNRLLVWDLPTRLFHWLLVSGCGAAFVLALETVNPAGDLFNGGIHGSANVIGAFFRAKQQTLSAQGNLCNVSISGTAS